MRTLLLVMLLAFSIDTCNQDYNRLVYVAHSRGFYLEITIDPAKITVVKGRDGATKERILNKTERIQLEEIIATIDFNDKIEAGTSRSAVDAAAMATFTCTLGNQNHEFNFDHGHPPEEIKELVNKVLTLSEIVE